MIAAVPPDHRRVGYAQQVLSEIRVTADVDQLPVAALRNLP